MDPRFEKLLKKPTTGKKKEPKVEEPTYHTPYHLLREAREEKGRNPWPQNLPEVRQALAFYHSCKTNQNLGEFDVAIVVLKGTSFEDKRGNCLQLHEDIMGGTHDGALFLEEEPENPFDKNAVIVKTETGKMIGYIPKLGETNYSYGQAMQKNRLTCAYIIDMKKGLFKGTQAVTMTLASVWKKEN